MGKYKEYDGMIIKKGDKVIVEKLPKTLFKGDFYDSNYNKRVFIVERVTGKFAKLKDSVWLLTERLKRKTIRFGDKYKDGFFVETVWKTNCERPGTYYRFTDKQNNFWLIHEEDMEG